MKTMVILIWLRIYIMGIEDDGQRNYLLTSERGKYSISYSSFQVLPYTDKEWFVGRIRMKCKDGFTYDEDSIYGPIPRRAYHCDADFIETEKGIYRGIE